MPKMTALLDGGGGGGGTAPSLGGPCHVLEGSYSRGEGGHIVKWRGCILRSGGGAFC